MTDRPLICSVHVNAAHRPGHLDRCLASFARQSVRDFEVVIADDGSDETTLDVIERWRQEAPFRIEHVWHPPDGHRRAEILNKGVAACRADYIVFTDCDALAPAWFVESHLAHRRPRRMLIGGRIKLGRKETEALTPESVRRGGFEGLAAPADLRELCWRHWKNVWEIWLRKRRRPHNLGLNMSLERAALEDVNGYDNAFRGWGNADGDLRERLKRVGVRPLSIWRECYVFHQWHPQLPRAEGNADYARRADIPVRARDGLAEAARRRETEDLPRYEAFRRKWQETRDA